MSKQTTVDEAAAILQRRERNDLMDRLKAGEDILRETLRCQIDATNVVRQDHHDMTTAEVARVVAIMSEVRTRLESWEFQAEVERGWIQGSYDRGELDMLVRDERNEA